MEEEVDWRAFEGNCRQAGMFEKTREKSLQWGLYAFSQCRFHEQEIANESAGQCHGANKSRYHFHPSFHPFLIILLNHPLLNSVSDTPLRCHLQTFSSHLNRHSVRACPLAFSYDEYHAVVLDLHQCCWRSTSGWFR
jgi:hypothetical protein